jgi:hypothetical protein
MQVIIWLPLLLLPGIATNTYAGQREAQQSQEKGLAAENGHLQAQLSALRRDLQKERQQLVDAREDGTVPLGTISELHKQVEALQEKTERSCWTSASSLDTELRRSRVCSLKNCRITGAIACINPAMWSRGNPIGVADSSSGDVQLLE